MCFQKHLIVNMSNIRALSSVMCVKRQRMPLGNGYTKAEFTYPVYVIGYDTIAVLLTHAATDSFTFPRILATSAFTRIEVP